MQFSSKDANEILLDIHNKSQFYYFLSDKAL